MLNHFKAISLSHQKAPLPIRELFALDQDAITKLLYYFKEFTGFVDLLILSTCNRVEVYYSSEKELGSEIIKRLGIEKNINNPIQYKGYFDSYNNPFDTVSHLFNVSMGMESKVLGDLHIVNQVKQAYQLSVDMDVAGPVLHRVMHTVFFCHKRVVRETYFKDGSASVSYTTVKLVQHLCASIENPKILLIGLGEMGAEICRYLNKTDLSNVWLSNRSFEKAQSLAQECNYQALTLKQGLSKVGEADLVISAVTIKQPIINRPTLKKKVNHFQYFIDLSVPRSIAPEFEKFYGVKVYNIDNIQEKVSQVLSKRREAKSQVKDIIKDSIAELTKWSQEMAHAPVINKMKRALEQIRQEELKRYLKNVRPEEKETLEQITKSMVQKIIKLPVLKLKTQCQRDDHADNLSAALSQLFNLEERFKDQPE